jgi:hypothetical protein
MVKVDVFVQRGGAYDREVFSRVTRKSLEPRTPELDLTTAEDIVLRKLEWFRLGNEISERQWIDVIGVIRVQGEALDRSYLRKWSDELRLGDLLERALREADDLAV